MSNRFELEQDILNCWNIIEDIGVLLDTMGNTQMSEDDIQNYLIGLKTIYGYKFEKAFKTFEDSLKKNDFKEFGEYDSLENY